MLTYNCYDRKDTKVKTMEITQLVFKFRHDCFAFFFSLLTSKIKMISPYPLDVYDNIMMRNIFFLFLEIEDHTNFFIKLTHSV